MSRLDAVERAEWEELSAAAAELDRLFADGIAEVDAAPAADEPVPF